MPRRTPWGAVAAASLVLLTSACGVGEPDAAPAPTRSTSAASDVGASHRIPDDFPIDRGFAEKGGQVEGPTHGDLTGPMDICGEFQWHLPLDRLTTWRDGGDGGGEDRSVLLFGNADQARAELAELRRRLGACSVQVFTDRSGEQTEVHYAPVAAGLPDGADATGRRSDGDARHSEGFVAVRRGPVILTVGLTAIGSGAIDRLQPELEAAIAPLYAAMCDLPQVTC